MTPNEILGVFSKNSLLLSGLIGIVITMITSSMILSITMERHQSFARCPNGYHISPSGVCEQVTPSSNNSPYQNPTSPYQQQPFSQPQQQQQLVELYNPDQAVACLNNVLTHSIIKAGTLHNNTRGITPGVIFSTFIDNATKTLDKCIVPTTTMTTS